LSSSTASQLLGTDQSVAGVAGEVSRAARCERALVDGSELGWLQILAGDCVLSQEDIGGTFPLSAGDVFVSCGVLLDFVVALAEVLRWVPWFVRTEGAQLILASPVKASVTVG